MKYKNLFLKDLFTDQTNILIQKIEEKKMSLDCAKSTVFHLECDLKHLEDKKAVLEEQINNLKFTEEEQDLLEDSYNGEECGY